MRSRILTLALICFASVFTSCENEESNAPKGRYDQGVFVVNEGIFNTETGSVSFIQPDSAKVYNNIFSTANAGEPLGDIAQSMSAYNDKFYVVVNNSNKVEVVNNVFTRVAKITGLAQPRYIAFANNKAYVSQWGLNGIDGSVAVVNLSSNTVVKTIPTGSGAEKMVVLDNELYVSNAGGYGSDSTVTVINTDTDEVLTKIKVGYNPKNIVVDKNNKLWVLCSGKWKSDYSGLEKTGALVCINPTSNTVVSKLDFASMYSQPSALSLKTSKDVLIYIYENKIFEMSINDNALPTASKLNRSFYNMGIDPVKGIIYGSDPKDYKSSGYVVRYSSTYAVIDSFKVGYIPGEIYFNY